ncbi:TPA: hypothetical protein N0F65_007505 [Lagenidium giganteum]|uniref:PDZ domain-containing protein n=1 Tax=Lagenidium giganteum TaxID=4803 RepID=A0AAV2ZNC8_9STRA|nr:TPA: hypothetical protein N0F65_007505 [Lagenidium giganteum]
MAMAIVDTAQLDALGKALKLPHPYAHEANRCFTLIEDWQELATLVGSQPIQIKPLGYYRTPDGVHMCVYVLARAMKIASRAIYVFECSMGTNDVDRKTWKIYRRYRHFQKYVAHSSEVLSSMVVPKLSQAYMKIFHAQSCKDRLVELHGWLTGVVDNTQAFCRDHWALHQNNDELSHSMESQEAMPAIMLSAFLIAGANNPFHHYFRGMPPFAFAMEEVNVQLTKAPVYPSKLRSSLGTSTGLGLRLTASHEQAGKFLGATVSGFLRDTAELDKSLSMVNVGARLVRINGVDVSDEQFEKILSQLRDVGLPLRLRFIYNPHLQRRIPAKSIHFKEDAAGSPSSVRHRLASSGYTGGSRASSSSRDFSAPARPHSGDAESQKRSYSVDARKTMGIFGSVFSDLFGRKRFETTEILLNNQVEEIFSWDDVGGEFQDIISRGFFTFLSQAFLAQLRRKRQEMNGEVVLDPVVDEKAWKLLDQRKGQGIWSTASGPLGICLGACKLRDVEAAMLEISPLFFSSRLNGLGSEKRLTKGFVLISINNESTFGMTFPAVIKMLLNASRPTSVCFRWYKGQSTATDYSPFLETELMEQGGAGRITKTDPANTFECALDCISEAQADLCNSLHLALVENASIRNEIGSLHNSTREFRSKRDEIAAHENELQQTIAEKDAMIRKLQQQLQERADELEKAKTQLKAADDKLVESEREYHQMLETAHANASHRIAEHEERLIKESNKSIENAKILAERKMQRQLEIALNERQRKHEEYLQKLAEEHTEELDSLNQQVAVWRHQVEVLTEAEKRNYAAMINSGSFSYNDYQRSRFGFADSPFSNSSGSARTYGGGRQNSDRPFGQQSKDEDSWGRGGDSAGSLKEHTYTELSERSASPAPSFWDRFVSLVSS